MDNKETNKQLSTIIPKLETKGKFTQVGFMVSEARATAFAMLADGVRKLLTSKVDSPAYMDAIEELHDVYVELMGIVEQESGGGTK